VDKSVEEIAAAVERLSEGLKELQQRVSALERPGFSVGEFLMAPSAQAVAEVESTSYVPVLGTAVLGIAGAYLLRAVAESRTLPFPVAVALTILYAACWLLAAVRQPLSRDFATITFAATGMLIVTPMLWETSARFHAIPPTVTAAVLAAFTIAGLGLSAMKNRAAVAWIVSVPAMVLALALMPVTSHLAPFIGALLAIAVVVERRSVSGSWPGLRWAAAIAADIALLDLIYVTARPEGRPVDFAPISGSLVSGLGIALLLIYGGSAVIRVFLLRRDATTLDLWQPLVTLWFLLPFLAMVVVLGAAAWIATRIAARTGRRILAIHAAGYLIAAGLLVGLLPFTVRALAGPALDAQPPLAMWIVAASALACYLVDRGGVALAVTALAVFSLAAAGIAALSESASILAASRTILICASAMALAYSAKRWDRIEFLWTARTAVAVAVLKILADDFRHASPAAIAVSLLCLGVVLIFLPRWSRPANQ